MMSYTPSNKYIKYINRAIFLNLQQKPLRLARLIVLNATHPQP